MGAQAKRPVSDGLLVTRLQIEVAYARDVKVFEVSSGQTCCADACIVASGYAIGYAQIRINGGATFFVLRNDGVSLVDVNPFIAEGLSEVIACNTQAQDPTIGIGLHVVRVGQLDHRVLLLSQLVLKEAQTNATRNEAGLTAVLNERCVRVTVEAAPLVPIERVDVLQSLCTCECRVE